MQFLSSLFFNRKKNDIKVKLEDLEFKILETEAKIQTITKNHVHYVKKYLMYSISLYILISCILFSLATSRLRYIILVLFIILSPFLIYLIKRFLDYFFNRYLKRSNSSFTLYNDTKNKLLETIMERETYNKAKELIDKYTKKDENKSINETKQLVEPDVSNIEKSRETEKIELIRPILSRNRSIMERFLDFILGDGPQNRFALICQNCFSHNGMSLIEEADYLSYRCCYCNYPNNPKLRESRKPYQMHNVDSKNDFPSNINRSQSLPRI